MLARGVDVSWSTQDCQLRYLARCTSIAVTYTCSSSSDTMTWEAKSLKALGMYSNWGCRIVGVSARNPKPKTHNP